jgi:hypothetical protein
MKSLSLVLALIVLAVCGAAPPLAAQAAPGTFRAGQAVEVEYLPGSGRWIPARVIEPSSDGFSYKVSVAPWGDGRTIQTSIHYRRVRAAASTRTTAAPLPAHRSLPAGHYGCTSSAYSGGQYEFTPRGSVELAANGTYVYRGFRQPSTGRYTVNTATGRIAFSGGYLDHGEATPIPDRPNRFYLVFPTIPGGRWTCGLQ